MMSLSWVGIYMLNSVGWFLAGVGVQYLWKEHHDAGK